MPFIMLTVMIDMLAIGLIIPVLPALVASFGGTPSEQAFSFGVVAFAFGLSSFFGSLEGKLNTTCSIGRATG